MSPLDLLNAKMNTISFLHRPYINSLGVGRTLPKVNNNKPKQSKDSFDTDSFFHRLGMTN